MSQVENVNLEFFKSELCDRLKSQYEQTWKESVLLCKKAILYKYIKTDFEFVDYLIHLPWSIAIWIVKLRTVNHKLAIETGIYINIDRELRFCELCNMDKIGDEYHLFFECVNPNIVLNRNRYVPNVIPNMYSFLNMLKSVNTKSIGCRIANFLKSTNVMYM